MAKKKSKKLIKLNNKVRELFGGAAFEDALAALPTDILIELSLVANADTRSLERDVLIKALRRIWSEGRYQSRSDILAYLTDRYKAKSLPLSHIESAEAGRDKVGKILSILSSIEHTAEEEEQILERFVELKHPRITPRKISNTLQYLRLTKKISKLEDDLGLSLDSNGDMEFYHSFTFHLPDVDFTKSLLVHVLLRDMGDLMTWDDTQLREYLAEQKKFHTRQKQNRIDELLASLFSRPHPYLSKDEIERYLRTMPPEADLAHIPLDFELLESILRKIDPEYTLVDLGSRYAIDKYKYTKVYSQTFPYRIRVLYDKAYLDAKIWRGDESLGISEDMESVDDDLMKHLDMVLDEAYAQAKELAKDLDVDDEIIHSFIVQFFDPQVIDLDSQKIQKKVIRRILYHFGEYLRPIREKKLREELLAKTIRDFKQLFPLARSLERKIIFYAGPTNSGKTYAAMEQLRSAQSGYYLAPLRLLALEGYESMRDNGVPVSLITGEEEIIDEDSTHISSTIEMLNFEVDVECCVIDEIQMIADRDRGWAWANALIGAPAKKLILTGSANAVSAVTELARYLNEELEVVYFERKNPLHLLSAPTPLKKIKPNTAIVAFSRKEVLAIKQKLSPYHNVSVVYGNLSPEVRREEARRFREGESDILVATDAIAMGLNLPIHTLLFARDNKFDGLRRRELETSEILQIAGRAGRYGLHEDGLIGALDESSLRTVADKFYKPLPEISLPFSVMASLHQVKLIGEILETDKLLDILAFFAQNMEYEGPFRAANIESMLEIAEIVDEYDLDLQSRYFLAASPVSLGSPYMESAFHRYVKHLEKGEKVPYHAPRDLPSYAHTNEELLKAEDMVKEVSLYLWLGYRFEEKFPDARAAVEARGRLNRFIEKSLSKSNFAKRCSRCGKILDFSYRYNICESCYRKSRQGASRKKDKRS